MQSTTTTPEKYLQELPEDRRKVIAEVRKAILKNLPEGFCEEMNNGMLGYVVPHSVYPPGYHCDPSKPLPFMCVASQKNYISIYHMSLYAESQLLDWFKKEFAKVSNKKLDMGKCCIRFKHPGDIPIGLIGELASKVTAREWIDTYEQNIRRK